MALLVGVVGLLGAAPAAAQDEVFDGLRAGQRVYDRTGSSLDPAERADLQRRLEGLPGGADAVVYVRELDADPEDTLDQVEALQRAWVSATGADEDVAVAFLINREPGEPDEARAGVFAGATFDEGNVPRTEQVDIVDEALIPPLREGDVHESLVAGVDRLGSSIRFGPPKSAFDRWAARAGTTWLPWVGLGVALVGLAAAAELIRRRTRTVVPRPAPTTTRPDVDLTPALGGGLAVGWGRVTIVPATVLAFAVRGALTLETQEPTGRQRIGVRARLGDRDRLRDDRVEQAVWDALKRGERDGVVPSSRLAFSPRPWVNAALRREIADRGWEAPGSVGRQVGLVALSVIAFAAMVFCMFVAGLGSAPLMLVAIAGFGLLLAVALPMSIVYPRLSSEALAAAQPWRAYYEGLRRAAKDRDRPLDLDVALPDVVAMGLGKRMNERIDAAAARGEVPRAFRDAQASTMATASWSTFSSTFPLTVSSGGSTVSGGGGGGGGGAAGST